MTFVSVAFPAQIYLGQHTQDFGTDCKYANTYIMPGPIVQSLACPIADPVLVGLLPAQPHSFVEIDHKIFSMDNLLLPLIEDGPHM